MNTSSAEIFLKDLGLDLQDENYKGTPGRVMEVFTEATAYLNGGEEEAEKILSVCFPDHLNQEETYNFPLTQGPIRTYSICSHHFLPVFYTIYFTYIPSQNKQVGFSKIARFFDLYSKQPMNQEAFTIGAIKKFEKVVKPQACAVKVLGVHLCTKIRGAKCDAITTTEIQLGDWSNVNHNEIKRAFFEKGEFVWM